MNEYEGGLPFSESLATDVINPCLTDLKRHPAILIIDGAPGTGKTTLAVQITDYANGEPTELDKGLQLAFGGKDLIAKAEAVAKAGFKVLIFDEADLDKRGALTKFNNNLFGFFREYRSLAILIIIVIQNVNWLDSRIFELGVVQGLIHLKNPQDNSTDYSVYDLENLSYLLWRMEKLGKQKLKAYSIVKGYMHGHFKNLPPERAGLLGGLSDRQKARSRKKRLKNTITSSNKAFGGKSGA